MTLAEISHKEFTSAYRQKNVQRADGTLSDKLIKEFIIFYKNIEYKKVIINLSTKDKNIEVDIYNYTVSSGTICIFQKTIYSKVFNIDQEKNIIQVNFIDGIKESDEIFQKIKKYLNEHRIKLFRKKGINKFYGAQHSYNSHEQILSIVKANLFLDVDERKDQKNNLKQQEQKPSENISNNNFLKNIYIYLIFFIFSLAFYNCASRHRDGCVCNDGTTSNAEGSGACSYHGGVRFWTYKYWWNK